MNCSSAEALFDRALEGLLGGGEHSAFGAHLDGCSTCREVFEELRAVDALLTQPRRVELAPNFTFATMAQARTLHPPAAAYRTPIRAYLVSYLAAAWLLAGASLVLAPQVMHALAGVFVDVARSIADAIGGVGTVVARAFGRGGVVPMMLLAALVILDAMLVAAFGLALKLARPGLAGRLRP